MDWVEGSFERAGARLAYGRAGPAKGVPLLLLHGGLGMREDFTSLLPGLAALRPLVALDSRGQGRSTFGDAPLTYATLEADAAALIAHLGLGAPDLLGFSDGGIVGLRLARAGLVRQLVVIGTSPHPPEGRGREILAGLTPEGWREMHPGNVADYERLNPAPDFAAVIEGVKALWLSEGPESYPGPSVAGIGCPLLVLRGDDDPFVTRAEAAALADTVTGARLMVLPFAGHAIHDDAPEAVLAALGDFLAT